MTVLWGPQLVGQLEFYWEANLHPRLGGLTDDEYFWEPVSGCWSVRRDANGTYVQDTEWPPPDPAPVTTIAWRMLHIATGIFTHDIAAQIFPDLATDQPVPGTVAAALSLIEGNYRRWLEIITALDQDAMDTPLGEAGGDFGAEPMGGLILHINREVMHHGGEIGVLRDLYRAGLRS